MHLELCWVGVFGLFPGQDPEKQIILMILPGSFLVYAVSLLLCLAHKQKLDCETLLELARSSIDCDWRHGPNVLERLLRHMNVFSPYCAMFGACYLVFYWVETVMNEPHYHCVMWGMYITSLAQSLWPFEQTSDENWTCCVYMILFLGMYMSCVYCWGWVSPFGTDDHRVHCQRVFAGIQHATHFTKLESPKYRCFNQWVVESAVHKKRKRAWWHCAPKVLSWPICWVFGVILSWPTLVYIVNQKCVPHVSCADSYCVV